LKIYWSPLAVDRLENIFEYISKEDEEAAYNLIEKIFKKVESLIEFPKIGRVVPELNKNQIREVFESNYRIIYRLESHKIFILTIRNFKQLLNKKDLSQRKE
jgi:plasmid stabilization system protein ParE